MAENGEAIAPEGVVSDQPELSPVIPSSSVAGIEFEGATHSNSNPEPKHTTPIEPNDTTPIKAVNEFTKPERFAFLSHPPEPDVNASQIQLELSNTRGMNAEKQEEEGMGRVVHPPPNSAGAELASQCMPAMPCRPASR